MQFSTLVTLKMMSETEKQQQYALLHFNNKQKKCKQHTTHSNFHVTCMYLPFLQENQLAGSPQFSSST